MAGKVKWECFHVCNGWSLREYRCPVNSRCCFHCAIYVSFHPESTLPFYVSLGISEQWGAKTTMKSALSRQFLRWHVALCSIASLSRLPRQVCRDASTAAAKKKWSSVCSVSDTIKRHAGVRVWTLYPSGDAEAERTAGAPASEWNLWHQQPSELPFNLKTSCTGYGSHSKGINMKPYEITFTESFLKSNYPLSNQTWWTTQ